VNPLFRLLAYGEDRLSDEEQKKTDPRMTWPGLRPEPMKVSVEAFRPAEHRYRNACESQRGIFRKAGKQETNSRAKATRDFFSWFPAFLPSSSVTWEAVSNSARAIGASEDHARSAVVEIDSRNLRAVRKFEPFAMRILAEVRVHLAQIYPRVSALSAVKIVSVIVRVLR